MDQTMSRLSIERAEKYQNRESPTGRKRRSERSYAGGKDKCMKRLLHAAWEEENLLAQKPTSMLWTNGSSFLDR
jgi:hypothetical protein